MAQQHTSYGCGMTKTERMQLIQRYIEKQRTDLCFLQKCFLVRQKGLAPTDARAAKLYLVWEFRGESNDICVSKNTFPTGNLQKKVHKQTKVELQPPRVLSNHIQLHSVKMCEF